MTRVIADISVSLDGFVTGPGPGPRHGLGSGGEALHTWAFSDDPDDRRVLREGTARSGAVVLGRRLFDLVDGPAGWDDTTGYGAGEVGRPAFVVVTSAPPESVRLTDLDWTFVTTGLPDAVAAARERAEAASPESGDGLDVVLMGGGARSAPRSRPVWSTRCHCTSRPSSWAPGRPCSPAVPAARWCSAARP
ncbi:hypothetical protein EDD94_7308 [Streptomyces sp. PanSC9]|nr:hypothetical protein EDD94_7308 [Streptomyces sp. PanSC9]